MVRCRLLDLADVAAVASSNVKVYRSVNQGDAVPTGRLSSIEGYLISLHQGMDGWTDGLKEGSTRREKRGASMVDS